MNDMPPLDREELIRRITRDIADSYDEELEMEIEDRHPLPDTKWIWNRAAAGRTTRKRRK
jgi:hypothetical protein